MTGPRAVMARRSPRAVLLGKRRRVRAETKAIIKQLNAQAASPTLRQPVDMTQLRHTLEQLRKSLGQGSGSTKEVAGALKDLDKSLQVLQKAHGMRDPSAAMNELAAGKQALDNARRKAKAAGRDWPL